MQGQPYSSGNSLHSPRYTVYTYVGPAFIRKIQDNPFCMQGQFFMLTRNCGNKCRLYLQPFPIFRGDEDRAWPTGGEINLTNLPEEDRPTATTRSEAVASLRDQWQLECSDINTCLFNVAVCYNLSSPPPTRPQPPPPDAFHNKESTERSECGEILEQGR
jgi:hypothetical protein